MPRRRRYRYAPSPWAVLGVIALIVIAALAVCRWILIASGRTF